MARINIEDRFTKDTRFTDLAIALGSRQLALGWMVDAWMLAQQYWLDDKQLIPKDVWLERGFPQQIISLKLAYEFNDGIKLRGIKKAFQWWFDGMEQRSLAGKKSAEVRRQKYGSAQPTANGRSSNPRTLVERTSNALEPSSSSSSSSSSSKKELTTKKLNNDQNAFDLVDLYGIYPRKVGRKKGLAKARIVVRTQQDFDNLKSSIERYTDHCQKTKTELQYIKHFSTFMNSWEDWLDPEVGTGIKQKTGLEEWYEQKLREENEHARIHNGNGQISQEVRQGLLSAGSSRVLLDKG